MPAAKWIFSPLSSNPPLTACGLSSQLHLLSVQALIIVGIWQHQSRSRLGQRSIVEGGKDPFPKSKNEDWQCVSPHWCMLESWGALKHPTSGLEAWVKW